MLTRGQVAKRIGKSIATVRRLEGVEFHPKRDAGGVFRFDPREVDRVAARLRQKRRGHVGTNGRSAWFNRSADMDDDLEQEDPEDRAHRERLRRQEEEFRAIDKERRQRREEYERRQAEQIRAQAETARLDALRSRVVDDAHDVARLLRSSSSRDLKRLRSDPDFVSALEDLFGDD